MIMGYVMALAVYTGAGWKIEKPLDNDLYPSYEICEQYAATINVAPDEKIVCGSVER